MRIAFRRKPVLRLVRVLFFLGLLGGMVLPGLVRARAGRAADQFQADTQATLSIPNYTQPAVASGTPGPNFTVDINISASVPTRDAQTALTFDPTILNCVSVVEGTFYSDWANDPANKASGTIVIPNPRCDNTHGEVTQMGVAILGGAEGAGPTGPGIFEVVTFKAIKNGVSALAIETAKSKVTDATSGQQALSLTMTNGMVVVGPTPTTGPSSTPTATPTPSMTKTPVPTSATPTQASIDCTRADVNQDGAIDIQDIGLVGLHWGEMGPDGWIPEDVIPDGVVDISDSARIGLCFGKPTTGNGTATPTPSPTLKPTSRLTDTMTFTVPTSPSPSMSPTASLSLTPTLSLTPSLTATETPTGTLPTASPTSSPTTSATPVALVSVDTPSGSVSAGQNFDVPVSLAIGITSRAASFGLSWDPAILQCNSSANPVADVGPFYNNWANANTTSVLVFPNPVCNNTAGTMSAMGLSILGGPASGPSGSGVIGIVHFTALASGTSPLTLTNVKVSDAGTVSDPTHLHTVFSGSTNGQVVVGARGSATMTSTTTLTRTNTLTLTPNGSATATLTPTLSATSNTTQESTATQQYKPSSTPRPTLQSSSWMGFDPAQSTLAAPGTAFTVNVVLFTDAPSREAAAGIRFDPSILQCSSVQEGTFYSTYASAHGGSTLIFPQPVINNTAGTISAVGVSILGAVNAVSPYGGPSGQAPFLVLHCTGKAAGVSTLSLTGVKLDSDVQAGPGSSGVDPMAVSLQTGQVFVGVTPTPTPQGQSTATPLPGTSITPGGGAAITPLSGGGPTSTGTPATATPPGEPANATIVPPATTADVKLSLADRIDSNGILKQDALLQATGLHCALKITAGTQALTPDNRPLLLVGITNQVQVPGTGKGLVQFGDLCDLSPESATFDPPAQISFSFDPASLPKGRSAASLVIATYDQKAGKWVVLNSSVDKKSNLVNAKIAHFSAYGLFSRSAGLNSIWWVLIGLVIAIAIGLAILFLLPAALPARQNLMNSLNRLIRREPPDQS